MAQHTIELDEECPSCKGTGIYKGMAERDCFGVVCHHCNGTGKYHYKHQYNDFTKRKKRLDVQQVLETNPGIIAGIGDKHQYTASSFGGIAYDDWFRGQPFPPQSEMRQFTCPAWWYQSANYQLKPDWCRDYGFHLGGFSDCPRFPHKNLCWQRFDKEHPNQEIQHNEQ